MYGEFVLLAGNNLYRKWVVVVSHMGKHNDLWVRPCLSIHPFVQTYIVLIIMYVINLFSQNCFIFLLIFCMLLRNCNAWLPNKLYFFFFFLNSVGLSFAKRSKNVPNMGCFHFSKFLSERSYCYWFFRVNPRTSKVLLLSL